MDTKDKIVNVHHLQSSFRKHNARLYVADYTNRTSGTRQLGVYTSCPKVPGGGGDMDCVEFENNRGLSLDFLFFDNAGYQGYGVKSNEHCEGVCYLAKQDPLKWMVFYEIKDCDPANIMEYKSKAMRQIFNVYKDFLNCNIIQRGVISYGIISYPQKHTSFNDAIFTDIIELKRLKKWTHINFRASNWIYVLNQDEVTTKTE